MGRKWDESELLNNVYNYRSRCKSVRSECGIIGLRRHRGINQSAD